MESLSVEILHMIMKNLNGREVVACRVVCRRWRDVVDAIPESLWEMYCCHDFCSSEEAKKISNLSYHDLYKSLTLWDKVEEAEIRTMEIPPNPSFAVTGFKLLSNQKLAVTTVEMERFRNSDFIKSSDTIRYFNIKSFELLSYDQYPFVFNDYDENETMIKMVDEVQRLHLILKSNSAQRICALYNDDDENYDDLTKCSMFLDTVYFLNSVRAVCVARINVEDGVETIEIEELAVFHNSIVAFAHTDRNGVNILTHKNYNQVWIYCYEDEGFNLSGRIDIRTRNINSKLLEFNFDWSDPNIYWVLNYKRICALVHVHLHVVLMSSLYDISIYKRPYNENRELMFYDQEPNRTIVSLQHKNYFGYFTRDDLVGVQQFGVVEILNGHRIIALVEYKLFLFDLLHNQKGKRRTCDDPTSSSKRSRN